MDPLNDELAHLVEWCRQHRNPDEIISVRVRDITALADRGDRSDQVLTETQRLLDEQNLEEAPHRCHA